MLNEAIHQKNIFAVVYGNYYFSVSTTNNCFAMKMNDCDFKFITCKGRATYDPAPYDNMANEMLASLKDDNNDFTTGNNVIV
jgi:hypothetical protein